MLCTKLRGKIITSTGIVDHDQGKWEVKEGGRYCDKWSKWSGGSDCDHIYVKGKEVLLINLNGSRSAVGAVEQGNSRGL